MPDTMTPKELAALLTGREYRSEVSPEERKIAAASGLVIVYGASDDLMEFDGVLRDEIGAWEGAEVRFDSNGIMAAWDEIDDADRQDIDFMRDYFKREGGGKIIKALWCAEEGYSWTFETEIPHETFEIVEDGEPYCRGIVFRLADAGTK